MRVLAFLNTQILTAVAYLNLNCDISIDHKWDIVGVVDTCHPTNLTVNKSDQFVATLNGNKTKMLDVHGFWVDGAQCQYIPRMIDSVLPNLRAIGFTNSVLKSLSKFDLAPFDELETLVLIQNRIEFLDGDLFEYNTNIKSLTLNESFLLIINGAILTRLNGLSVIEFELKKLKDTCEGNCRDKRCMKQTIDLFSQNCEFDSIYPGFKKAANALKDIGKNCEGKI